jgi:hypothetical protein
MIAEKVYDVLEAVCGAHESAREDFVYNQANGRPPREWRFQGALGFGGKFWANGGEWYVNCYREDETPERRAMITQANEALRDLTRELQLPS